MSGEGHPVDCPDCERCGERDCERVAWCVSEHPVNPPCEHWVPVCSDHWPGTCIPCRLAAEREMFVAGEYDPRKDPYYNPEAAERDRAYWDTGVVEVAAGVFRHQPKDSA